VGMLEGWAGVVLSICSSTTPTGEEWYRDRAG
jgi:hypothetical protein